MNLFLNIITPYIKILDSYWLIPSVFLKYFPGFINFTAPGVYAMKIFLFYPLCCGICQMYLRCLPFTKTLAVVFVPWSSARLDDINIWCN